MYLLVPLFMNEHTQFFGDDVMLKNRIANIVLYIYFNGQYVFAITYGINKS